MRRSIVGELALLVLAMALIPACGSGGSNSGGAVPPVLLPASTIHVHESSVTPTQVIAASSSFTRTATFVPIQSQDEILRVVMEGAAIGDLTFNVELRDPSGNLISKSNAVHQVSATQFNFRVELLVPETIFSTVAAFPAYPTTSYGMFVSIQNGSGVNSATLVSLKFRITVMENPTITVASGQISG